MATIKWEGGTSTDASVAANWAGGSLPTSSDVVSFTGSVSNACDMTNLGAETYQKITVTSDYDSTVTFSSQTITLTDGVGLEIYKAGVFDCGSNVIFDFTGTPTGNAYNSDGTTTGQPLYTILIDSSNDSNLDTSPTGVFIDETDRSNTTFVFKNSSASLKMYLMDGVYPNVTFEPTAATTFDTRNAFDTYTASDINTLSKMNEYGKVSMLNFTVTDTDITVSAGSKNYDDLNKIFKIKGSIATIGANTFDWGYATLELEPTANSTIPCTGSTTHGSGFFKAHYHKLVIQESASNSYYYLLETDLRLNCNELVVNGRLYGNSDYNSSANTTAEIHTVKSPTINGDWNFQQISDGIYRARGTLELTPVAYGGTGRRFLTSNNILYGQGSSQVGLDANFTYDPTEELLEVGKVKSHIIIQVQNDTGSTIPKGAAVYVDTEGTHPSVALADADDATKMPSIGIIMEQIADGASGYAAVNGIITISSSQITDTLSDPADVGKTLYVSPTAGELTITKPQYASQLIQNVGKIADINGSNVKVIISNIGRTNDTPNTALHPIFYERSALNTNAYDFRSPTATGATAFPNAFPMPFNGRVAAATFLFAGGTPTGTATNTIRIRKNGGTSGSDIQDFTFTPSDLTNTNGTNWTLVKTGADVDFDFSAGDILQVKRQSGTTNLYNGQAVLWVKFDNGA